MGRGGDLEKEQGSHGGLGTSAKTDEDYASRGRRVPILLRQSALSKGIRIYWHNGKQRSRASYNYEIGICIVRMLIKWTQLKVVAIGSEEGAMCLHYKTA